MLVETLITTKHEDPGPIIPNALAEMYRHHHTTVFRTAYRATGTAPERRTPASAKGRLGISWMGSALVFPIRSTSVSVCSTPTSLCTRVEIPGKLARCTNNCLYSELSDRVSGLRTRIME